MERKPIETQKWIYHLSSLNNLAGILTRGLLSRAGLKASSGHFQDVADPEILEERAAAGLDNFVPFHFFPNNPFDGRVQTSRRGESFFYTCISRDIAKARGYLILPKHPLAKEHPETFEYTVGFGRVDWERMNTRDYKDQETKLICMAECLSPHTVPAQDFAKLIFKTEQNEAYAKQYASQIGLRIDTWVNPKLFTKI